MKGFAAVFFFAACFISFSIDTGSALKCYTCTGVVGKKSDCEVNVKNAHSEDCPAELDSCYTLITKGDVSGIARSCMVKSACDLIDKSTYKYCQTCTSDLCNTYSSGFVPSYSTSVLVSMAFFALTKLFM